MSGDASDATWQAAIAFEEACRRDLYSKDRHDLQTWWQSLETLLRLSREQQRTLPGEVTFILEELSGFLATGVVPQTVSGVRGRGNTRVATRQRRYQQLAVAYRRAATDAGLEHLGSLLRVEDRHPVANLSSWYGASVSLIQQWCRDYDQLDLLGPLDGAALMAMTPQAGLAYSLMSETHVAITWRTRQGRIK